ncbi:inactive transglutaminase family protein [Gilvimarinus sp. F26214L]|uniref:inactive transglutaminase family protein n=1 Tax=Gilvimarinus sp. DZF01 TaxID=3461371 RepID=UPI0040451AD8
MNSRRTPFYLLILFLVAAGLWLSWHRHVNYEVPWLPGENRQVWSVEAKIDFTAFGDPVKVNLSVPDSQPGFERVREHTASPGYGLAFVTRPTGGRSAEWSIRNATGQQTLYYQVEMLVDPERDAPNTATPPPLDPRPHTGPTATAAMELLENARRRSADAFTLTRELIEEFNTQAQSAQLLTQHRRRSAWLVDLLHMAGTPAREVQVLELQDGRRRQPLQTYLQVFEGDTYQLFNPNNGRQGLQPNQLLWEYHSGPLLEVVGGRNSTVSFSIIDQEVPVGRVLEVRNLNAPGMLDFSLHSLPVAEQTLFKSIVLIPVGVLVVCLLRILVGIRTSGTFMPALIAMAFIQTSLLTGLIGFILIVSAGLMIRSYLSHLNLLLVARISAVIISVIIIIALFSVLAFQLGLAEGLKITFFPVIILSWTIERMSILWEEEGPREVVVQGGGSLLVAVLAYAVMTNDIVRHLTFNFLGLQLVFMAAVLLLGSYTGYRLLEVRRFRPLVQAGEP